MESGSQGRTENIYWKKILWNSEPIRLLKGIIIAFLIWKGLITLLKIIIINSSDVGGGAEKVCLSLNNYYNKSIHTSYLVVGKKLTNDKRVIQIPNEENQNFLVKYAKYISKYAPYFTKHLIKYMFIPKNWNHRRHN